MIVHIDVIMNHNFRTTIFGKFQTNNGTIIRIFPPVMIIINEWLSLMIINHCGDHIPSIGRFFEHFITIIAYCLLLSPLNPHLLSHDYIQ